MFHMELLIFYTETHFGLKCVFGICSNHRLELRFLLSAVIAKLTSTPRLRSKSFMALFAAKGGKRFLVPGLWAE